MLMRPQVGPAELYLVTCLARALATFERCESIRAEHRITAVKLLTARGAPLAHFSASDLLMPIDVRGMIG